MRRYVEEDLGYRPDRVRTLLDADATREGIISGIRDWLLAGDRALLYFSGHGYHSAPTPTATRRTGSTRRWVPYDVVIENGVVHGMIADDEIDDLISATDIPVEIIIDSCHSGTATAKRGRWRCLAVHQVASHAGRIAAQARRSAQSCRRTGSSPIPCRRGRKRHGLGGGSGRAEGACRCRQRPRVPQRVHAAPAFRAWRGGRRRCERNGRCGRAGDLRPPRIGRPIAPRSQDTARGGLVPEISVPPGRSDASAFARVPPPSPIRRFPREGSLR